MRRSIAGNTVHLWVVRPGDATDPQLVAGYRALLAPDEAARAARFHFDVHRHEYIVTRALVRTVISEYRDGPAESWRFTANAYGRPALTTPNGLVFNLSNTTSLVVCAVSERRELGVDVEPLARAPDILEVADTVFTTSELAELRSMDRMRAADRAVSLWTFKEAYMKARGMGMSLPPREFSIAFRDDACAQVRVVPTYDDGRSWIMRALDVDEHRVALCVEGVEAGARDLEIEVRRVVPLRGG
jgi:4'-phosphopantetheinyl transferase